MATCHGQSCPLEYVGRREEIQAGSSEGVAGRGCLLLHWSPLTEGGKRGQNPHPSRENLHGRQTVAFRVRLYIANDKIIFFFQVAM